MHCSCYGEIKNFPLLFLHGFLGSGTDWINISEALSLNHYCICLDLPGHGKTDIVVTKNSYNIENTAKYIINFLQDKNIHTCGLVGYSMGGRISIYLAIHYPKFFKKIIIESAQPGIEDVEEREQRKKHDSLLAQKLKSNPLDEFLEFWYNQQIFESLKHHKNFANLLKSRLNNNSQKCAKSLLEIGAGFQPSLWIDLKRIKSPCLLVTGEYDLKYQKIFSKMHQEIFSSDFVIIKNAGHNSHFENPEEFSKVVKKFLSN